MEERIELYCRIYEKICERLSKENHQEAVNVALKIFEEVARDLRGERRRSRNRGGRAGQNGESGRALATEKQRRVLHRFRIKDIPEGLTKKEASEILDNLIALSKNKDGVAIGKFVEELNRKWVGERGGVKSQKEGFSKMEG